MFTRFLLTTILYNFNVVVGGNCDITDVRVIHPLVSKDNIHHKHPETNKVHVPSNNRAPKNAMPLVKERSQGAFTRGVEQEAPLALSLRALPQRDQVRHPCKIQRITYLQMQIS